MADTVRPDKLKVVELRAELKKRALSTGGNKAELVARLEAAISEDNEKATNTTENVGDKAEEAIEKDSTEQKDNTEGKDGKRKREDEDEKEDKPSEDKDTEETEKKKARTEEATDTNSNAESTVEKGEANDKKRKLEMSQEKAEVSSVEQTSEESQSKKPRLSEDLSAEITPIIPKDRQVPKSTIDPTKTLLIKNFVRPFTVKAAELFLAQYGKLEKFWMNDIKTHCYVTFESKEDARDTREQIYGVIWPPHNTSKPLTADFVSDEVVSKLGPGQKLRSSDNAVGKSEEKVLKKEEPQRTIQKKEPAPVLTLEDIFRKTVAKPSIYYLPLTDQEITARKEAKAKEQAEREQQAKEREEQRRKEREERMKEREKEREKERQEREKREKERDERRKRSRSRSRSSRSRSRSRSRSSRSRSRSSRSRSRSESRSRSRSRSPSSRSRSRSARRSRSRSRGRK